jgi:carboxypeptidase C (cathepsin A)
MSRSRTGRLYSVGAACAGLVVMVAAASGQSPEPPQPAAPPQQEIRAESRVTSEHAVTIKGQRVPYRATAGTQPVWNAEGRAVASLFYVFYERTDVKDRTAPAPGHLLQRRPRLGLRLDAHRVHRTEVPRGG